MRRTQVYLDDDQTVRLDRRAAVEETAGIAPTSEVSRIEALQRLRSAERSHPGIAVADLAIAATAEQIDATVATRNLEHFPMFRDLNLRQIGVARKADAVAQPTLTTP